MPVHSNKRLPRKVHFRYFAGGGSHITDEERDKGLCGCTLCGSPTKWILTTKRWPEVTCKACRRSLHAYHNRTRRGRELDGEQLLGVP